jgi:excisionase family DNA binding protein
MSVTWPYGNEITDKLPDEQLVFSITDLSRWLCVSKRHVCRHLKTGEIASVKLGRRRLIPRVAVMNWLAGHKL